MSNVTINQTAFLITYFAENLVGVPLLSGLLGVIAMIYVLYRAGASFELYILTICPIAFNWATKGYLPETLAPLIVIILAGISATGIWRNMISR